LTTINRDHSGDDLGDSDACSKRVVPNPVPNLPVLFGECARFRAANHAFGRENIHRPGGAGRHCDCKLSRFFAVSA
jgi:hypothetical protein